MTLSDSFWSFSRIAGSWTHSAPQSTAPCSKVVFTQQHIETIGGSNHVTLSPSRMDDMIKGHPRLPVEIVVHIVLFAAAEIVCSDHVETHSYRLLGLARVNKPCHRAIVSLYLLPRLNLFGFTQIRSFAVALDQDHLYLRNLANTRVKHLIIRARGLRCLQHGYGPALFDASQAQTHFEKNLLPFIRIILSHCKSVQKLDIEGVPKGLQKTLENASKRLDGFSCLMGHYGSELERNFWKSSRWTKLNQLQLHGPRFRFTTTTASVLSHLPHLKKLALVVPMIVCTSIDDTAHDIGIEMDLTRRNNPLQILVDRMPNLQHLLLVGHEEKDYVGYTEKYRNHLRSLRQPRLSTNRVNVELVTVIRKYTHTHVETDAISSKRVHPSKVSAWMMTRSQHDLQWFNQKSEAPTNVDEELDFWIERFEISQHPSNLSSTVDTTTALMNRIPSYHPQHQSTQQQHRVVDIIEAADMLDNNDDDDEEEEDGVFDESG
ncbi:uncharacterized protein MEPE_06469 [Melanopsichium pennsylvanicum]|uniref:F-box domain-containing protein n=1 Tax=Melanopsichium pennsylvanicum TaxID=63383 RepID=A0AAJ4XUB6_9BASI|nr:uncharacterized protein MEPE_06469 [Melanopsichium pennsylvanicum]